MKRTSLCLLAATATLGVHASEDPQVLFDNGPFVTSDGLSALQTGFDTLGYVCLGYSATPSRVADDFRIPFDEVWIPTAVKVYAYQAGNVRSTFTRAYVGVFDVSISRTTDLTPRWGSLDPLTAANALVDQVDINVVRGPLGASQRNVMELTLALPATGPLAEGVYHVAWGLRGSTDTATVASVPVVPARSDDNGLVWGRVRHTPPGRENFWQICDGFIPTGGDPGAIEPNDLAFRVLGTKEKLPTGEISGSIVAPGHDDLSKLVVEAEVRDGATGEVRQLRPVVVEADGSFRFATTVLGSIALSVKPIGHLRETVGDLHLTESGLTGVVLELRAGDIDGDNTVTVFDYDRLSAAFDSAPGDSNWDPDADLDGDGTISVFDYDLLSANFDASGDE